MMWAVKAFSQSMCSAPHGVLLTKNFAKAGPLPRRDRTGLRCSGFSRVSRRPCECCSERPFRQRESWHSWRAAWTQTTEQCTKQRQG